MASEAYHLDESADYSCRWCDNIVLDGTDYCEECEERGKPPPEVYDPKPMNHQQRKKYERKMKERKQKNAARMRRKRKNQTPEQRQIELDKNAERMREKRAEEKNA